jgi:pyridoxine 5-phosphate synthase
MRLHINVDHVATLRNARGSPYPDPVLAAGLCELAGADGITAHLREDRRHMRDDDIRRLRASVVTLLNLEMAATDSMIEIARDVGPDVITLVPERREERTTEGGLDVFGARAQIEKAANMCERARIKLSLFIEPDTAHVDLSRELGARQVELHTGQFCLSAAEQRGDELTRLARAADAAHALGLEVAAGHGLTRHNVALVAGLRAVEELNIGHSVIADALFMGLERAVAELRAAVARGLSER